MLGTALANANPMPKILSICFFLALFVAGCTADLPAVPPLGALQWQTATVCVVPELADTASEAAAAWHDAAPAVAMRIIQRDGLTDNVAPGCDAVMLARKPTDGKGGNTWPGLIVVDPNTAHPVPVVTHELGHLLTGGDHATDPADIMYASIQRTPQTITARDLALLAQAKEE